MSLKTGFYSFCTRQMYVDVKVTNNTCEYIKVTILILRPMNIAFCVSKTETAY